MRFANLQDEENLGIKQIKIMRNSRASGSATHQRRKPVGLGANRTRIPLPSLILRFTVEYRKGK